MGNLKHGKNLFILQRTEKKIIKPKIFNKFILQGIICEKYAHIVK